jgi:hypothetical protein
MMIPCVIQNHINLPIGMTASHSESFEKSPKCIGIELFLFSLVNELAITKTHCSKITHAFSGWVMQQNRFFDFGWNPHSISRPMLLKMNLVQGPYINVIVGNQTSGFFLNALCSSSLARTISERGFLKRKSNSLNRRWHCRTPNKMPNSL